MRAYYGLNNVNRATLSNIEQHWAHIETTRCRIAEWQIDEKYSPQPYLFVVKNIRTVKVIISRAFSTGSNMSSLKVNTIFNSQHSRKSKKIKKKLIHWNYWKIFTVERIHSRLLLKAVFNLRNGNRSSYPSYYYKIYWNNFGCFQKYYKQRFICRFSLRDK